MPGEFFQFYLGGFDLMEVCVFCKNFLWTLRTYPDSLVYKILGWKELYISLASKLRKGE